jgi:hypothetical protein
MVNRATKKELARLSGPTCSNRLTVPGFVSEVNGQVRACTAGDYDLAFGREQADNLLAEQSSCADYQDTHRSSCVWEGHASAERRITQGVGRKDEKIVLSLAAMRTLQHTRRCPAGGLELSVKFRRETARHVPPLTIP